MVKRSSHWGEGNWCIVNRCNLKPADKNGNVYGDAYGHIHYADGNEVNGKIPNAGCGGWSLIKILE